jgi:hypothetical protein
MTVMPTPLQAARELAPKNRAVAAEIEAERELPRALFEAIADAGLFRLALPRSIGGFELDLPSYIQVIEELGKADASTGWVVNQCAVFATYAARMPRADARAIWIDTPRCVISNTPMATARAVAVPGGYRVTGRQGFSTQHRLPARGVPRGPRPGVRRRPGPPRGGRPARGALLSRAGGLCGTGRHLEGAGHARHGHAPLRGERRLRA